MSKLIGLRSINGLFSDSWDRGFSILKQQAIIFDQIGIIRLDVVHSYLEALRSHTTGGTSHTIDSVLLQLESMQQSGIIYDLKLDFELSDLEDIKAKSSQKYENIILSAEKMPKFDFVDLLTEKDEKRRIQLVTERDVAVLRIMSIVTEATKGATTVTTFPYTEYTRELQNSTMSHVAQIIINKLPLPNTQTPWKQIIDFRNDTENQKNLLNLRRWIRKISTGEISPVEIEEEIEWLMHEFQSHMKLHKLKSNTETLEVIIKAPLEVVENLATLKFSKIPELLFALKKRQINLIEAELNAPGKEMAYLIKARDTFQDDE